MRRYRNISALLLGIVLIFGMTTTAYAVHEVPDMNKKGTISITMKCGDNIVPGGTLTVLRVGVIAEDDGNYNFELNEDFKGSQVELYDEIEVETDEPDAEPQKELQFAATAEKAKALAEYAKEKGYAGQTLTIGNDGKVVFEDMEPALYLFVQDTAATGYYAADPFMVSIPVNEAGVYIYDVDATPKVGVEKLPPPPPIPQTGQLNWPIPVLVVAGLLLVALGWSVRYKRR